MNVIERSSTDILFNHVCTDRCQIKANKHDIYSRLRCGKKHEVYSTLRCPLRASNDKYYERLQDISRMSAETLIDNPNFIRKDSEAVNLNNKRTYFYN